jgi:hypothetical protein
MSMLEGFLLGVIVAASVASALFFLKFWKNTRDGLFLAFSAAFFIEGVNRMGAFFIERPNEGSAAIYIVRLLAFLLILVAIARKNRAPAH